MNRSAWLAVGVVAVALILTGMWVWGRTDPRTVDSVEPGSDVVIGGDEPTVAAMVLTDEGAAAVHVPEFLPGVVSAPLIVTDFSGAEA